MDERCRDRRAEKREYYRRKRELWYEYKRAQQAKIKADPDFNAERRSRYVVGTGNMYRPKFEKLVEPEPKVDRGCDYPDVKELWLARF